MCLGSLRIFLSHGFSCARSLTICFHNKPCIPYTKTHLLLPQLCASACTATVQLLFFVCCLRPWLLHASTAYFIARDTLDLESPRTSPRYFKPHCTIYLPLCNLKPQCNTCLLSNGNIQWSNSKLDTMLEHIAGGASTCTHAAFKSLPQSSTHFD